MSFIRINMLVNITSPKFNKPFGLYYDTLLPVVDYRKMNNDVN